MNIEKSMYDLCKEHMHSYVLAELNDGSSFDGIVTGLDDEHVYFAVPIEGQQAPESVQRNDDNQRQFGYFGYPFSPYYWYPWYYPPGRRFRRLVLPLAALTALSILPWY